MKTKPVVGTLTILVLILSIWLVKPYLQPMALWFRIHLFEGIVIIGSAYMVRFFFKKKKGWPVLAFSAILLLFCIGILTIGKGVRTYHQLYRQFVQLNKQEIKTEPLTDFERLQPMHSIHMSSNKRISDVKQTTIPNFVRWRDGRYVWSLGIEPEYLYSRLTGSVEKIFVLSGQNAELDFSQKNQEEVSFRTGDMMLFAKDLRYLTRQGFGPWKFFNYEPGDVKYIPGPDGEVVQILSLIRWKGIIFPKPEFGGLMVTKQSKKSSMTKMFIGEHEWIRPEEVSKHSWLVGQDITPFAVSRNIAESFRFRYGYKAPMPGFHIKDIRIPDMVGDNNEQPFSTYFNFGKGDARSKLYHYFALEPYNEDKRGLNTSIFVPADGVGSVMYFGHDDQGQNLIGVSAVSTYIKDANKTYDWSRSDVAEHRPWVKKIGGEIRHFWLSTVVTRLDGLEKDGTSSDFIAGSAIEIFLTDSRSGLPIRVTANRPDLWVSEVEQALQVHAPKN